MQAMLERDLASVAIFQKSLQLQINMPEKEGLYKGCYAMLFCRVILGEQLHTKMFRREESAAEASRGGYDSILAEPHGAVHREFVVLDGKQIYPECALVYEGQGIDFGMCPL